MRKKILAYIIAVLTITTCMIQLIPRQNNIFKIASQGEGESGFLTNNNLNQKKVYLTFDDGPSDHTDEILDILKKNKVRATFFVVGKETEHAKKMYRRIILEGHTLGMHSYSHNYDQIYASVGAFSKDLMKLQKYLYDLTEVKSYIYRFPGGSSNHCAGDIKPYIRYVNQKGILYFDWNALNADAEGPRKNAQQLADYAIKTAQGKEMVVMLMHDTYGKEETVKALPTIIKYFKDNGYEFRTLA